jgi:hypothetical protein
LVFISTRPDCIGCSACRVACNDWPDIPAGPENWVRILYTEKRKFPEVFVGYMIAPCWHCLDPVCKPACPVRELDSGPLEELGEKYGTIKEAEAFKYETTLRGRGGQSYSLFMSQN